jgi:ribosomal protein S20
MPIGDRRSKDDRKMIGDDRRDQSDRPTLSKGMTMFKTRKRKILSLVGALALALVIGGVSLLATGTVANAAEQTTSDLRTITQVSTGPGLLGEGYLAHGGWGGRGGLGGAIDYQQLLADALGITVDKLQAAYETARTKAIDQAVEQGLITKEQADEMKVWGDARRGWFGLRRGPKGVSRAAIDENALLAEALGITVDELQAAREAANQAAIDQAVAEGLITQEQADQMQARRDLQSYLNRDVLLAKALGMTVEELQAAYADGATLSDLMSERGLEAAAVREKLLAAYDEALAQAVADGVITQEQADEMQDRRAFGFGDPSGFSDPFGSRGRMGPGGRGGFRAPCPPGTDTGTEDSSGARFSRPGTVGRPMRGVQADSTF